MNVNEAKLAMERHYGVKHIEASQDTWGTISALSDDESTAYIKPRGMGLPRKTCEIKYLELVWPWSKKKGQE